MIEFTGISGCGKSTLAGRLDAEFRSRGYATGSRSLLIRADAEHALGRPLATLIGERGRRLLHRRRRRARLVADFQRSQPGAWSQLHERLAAIAAEDGDEARLVERWVETKLACLETLRAHADRFSLFFWEEGIAHRAVNLFVSHREPPDSRALAAFLAVWPFPDVLLHVRCTPATALARIESRGLTGRLEGRGRPELLAFLERSRVVTEAIVAEAERRGVPVQAVDNEIESGADGPEPATLTPCIEALETRLEQAPVGA